jgi:hypothetical protein
LKTDGAPGPAFMKIKSIEYMQISSLLKQKEAKNEKIICIKKYEYQFLSHAMDEQQHLCYQPWKKVFFH